MAVPKKKTSPSRRGLRRAGQHHKLYAKSTRRCPECGGMTLPHTVCMACGVYGKHRVFTPKSDDDEEESE